MTVKAQVWPLTASFAVLGDLQRWVSPPASAAIGCGGFGGGLAAASPALQPPAAGTTSGWPVPSSVKVTRCVAPPLVMRTVSSLNCGMRKSGSLLLAVVCGFLAAGQEDRRAAGIGGRRHPGVDAHVRLRLQPAAAGERHRKSGPALVGIGIGEGDTGKQHREGAQARNGRCGQCRAAEDPFPARRSSAPCASGVLRQSAWPKGLPVAGWSSCTRIA